VFFHAAETAEVTQVSERCFHIRVEQGTARLHLDGRLRVEVLRGSTDPIGGWVSRGYHRRSPSTTIVGRTRSDGDLTCVCRVEIRRDNAS
jgi:hypothetical protein